MVSNILQLSFIFLTFLPNSISLKQDLASEIVITNNSEDVICYVFISSADASTWGNDWLGNSIMLPGQTLSFYVDAGIYDIALETCADEELLTVYGLTIHTAYTLIFNNALRDAYSDYSTGLTLYRQNNYQAALRSFLQALPIFQQTDFRVSEGAILNFIGSTYMSLGNYQFAQRYLEQALPLLEQENNRAWRALVLDNLGQVHYHQNDYENALEYYQLSIPIVRELDNRVNEAVLLNNIGAAYYKSGDYDRALSHYLNALAIYEETGNAVRAGTVLVNIGVIYRVLGQNDISLEYYQRGLSIRREAEDRPGEGITLTELGRLHEQLDRLDEAIEYYQAAIEIKESLLNDVQDAELIASLAGEVRQIFTYGRLIELLWRAGRDEEAYNYVERARARAFLHQVAREDISFSLNSSIDPFLERERTLRNEIQEKRRQLRILFEQPRDSLDSAEIRLIQTELHALEAGYNQLIVELRVLSPEAAAFVAVDFLTVPEVQNLLDINTTLIEYFVLTDNLILAFIITRDKFYAIALPINIETLTELVLSYYDFADVNIQHSHELQKLHETLFAPLQEFIHTPNVGFVPHSILHYIPFAALTDGQRFLVEKYVVFVIPSASMLALQTEERSTHDEILIFGNPLIDAPLPNLSHAEAEAKKIARLYGTQAFLGTSATESVVKTQGPNAGILHFATHGEYNSINPMFSVLHLASGMGEDGRLEVHEIHGLDLKSVDLVVLSACQTQVGTADSGDEVVALSRAFLGAGAATVIGTLWRVDDEATSLLMEQFYIHIRGGMGKAEALRQAQIDLRTTFPEYEHPYYWAAFVLAGDPGRVADGLVISQPPLPDRIPQTGCLWGSILVLLIMGLSFATRSIKLSVMAPQKLD